MLLFRPRNALPSFLLAFRWLLRRHHSLHMHGSQDQTYQQLLSVSVLTSMSSR